MIYIQRVRNNDIGDDYGKQVELGKAFMANHNWEEGHIPVKITFHALSEDQLPLNGTDLYTSFKVRANERGGTRKGVDCKEYANTERICVLKQFLTEKLHLVPGDDYFVLEDTGKDGRTFKLYALHGQDLPASILLKKFNGEFVEVANQSRPFNLPDLKDIGKTEKIIITAIRTKPFILLAGISGTGKSRIVRQLAKACWDPDSKEGKAHKPSNFEMIQVKPNWHDSSELLGYVSRIGEKPTFIAGDFLKFIVKAWENPDIPFFLCLDEMNLAPVEQYFAEFLSVMESRKLSENGTIVTDPILKKEDEEWYIQLIQRITSAKLNSITRTDFNTNGIRLPQNLIVVGTVNMDETTYGFSRKVLDRAMTIEMNEVDLDGGLDRTISELPFIPVQNLLADSVEGYDVYEQHKDVCDTVIDYLKAVNNELENTPFKVAYRTRNEFLIYVVNALRLAPEEKTKDQKERNKLIADALDEVTSMKILSRIEGDKRKVPFLKDLTETVKTNLNAIDNGERSEGLASSPSLSKLKTMKTRLDTSGYTSFWD